MVFKKTVSSHTDVVDEATEILQSVPVVVVLDDILYSSVAVLIAGLTRVGSCGHVNTYCRLTVEGLTL